MATFFNQLFKRESTESTQTAGSESTAPKATGHDIVGHITYASGEHSSLSVPAFYRAMTLRGNTISRLLMQYQKATPF